MIEDPCSRISVKRSRSSGALYALRRAGTLTDAHVTAAEHWARDYETGILGGRDPEASRQCGCADAEYALLSRIGAADRCRYVKNRVGSAGEKLLICLMIDGLSISIMSNDSGKPRARLTGSIELLLEQLSEIYTNLPPGLLSDWSSIPAAKSLRS
ncbi:hypothetical protein K2X14_07780 [Acetobacter sp. TBRC 12305]|uniref:Uncharacterized protein n=1 Tax=Acetobacter garciniae TaxID=2817435 RepID=A0A939HN53_9PROT|nr:hypothetical protein [Acetobacter garciniae]MBX0344732.1 hypothetical protein [Acetobacter garciniae]